MLYQLDGNLRYSTDGNTRSTIKLVITYNMAIQLIYTHPDLQSDHLSITMTIKSKPSKQNSYRIIKANANWTTYRTFLIQIWRLIREFEDNTQLDETTDNLTKLIKTASNK